MHFKIIQACIVIIHCNALCQALTQEPSDEKNEHNNKRVAIIGAGIGKCHF